MPLKSVFVDTVPLLAFINRDDALHEDAFRIHNDLTAARIHIVTSEWILTEFLNGASRLALREAAYEMVERHRQSRRATIIPATHEDWLKAFDLYGSRQDKEWSLVDCTSILICQEMGIRQVFTEDRHFVQAGFEILL